MLFRSFRDTLNELNSIGREVRVLESFFIEGDAYRYRQLLREGRPDWDTASIVAPQGALLFALDLDYAPDPQEKVFRFSPPRQIDFTFDLPSYLRRPVDLFRIDAEGVHEVKYQVTARGVTVHDNVNRVAIYVVARSRELRGQLEQRRKNLLAEEASVQFDPASNNADFATLEAISQP